MALNLKHIEKISKKRKLSVYGFIREYEKANNHEIMKEIVLICLLFYGDTDKWDPNLISDCFQLKDRTITQTGHKMQTNSYCKRIVQPGIHRWQFQLKMDLYGREFLIGIFKVIKQKTIFNRIFFLSDD